LMLIVAVVLAGLYQRQLRRSGYRIEQTPAGTIVSENHLAPAEDLEAIDLDRLDAAQKNVDIAMYAFTHRELAEGPGELARRGVRVRLYRDGEQYEEERRNAQRYGDEAAMDLVRGESNIEVRVKKPSRRDLMHLKAYALDGRLLRDGSANWSLAGEKIQD